MDSALFAAEDKVDAGKDERELALSESSGPFLEDGTVDGDDLGDVRDGVAL